MVQLKEGAVAPQFTGKDQDGKTISLRDFIGRNVILYFYPKDDTPGCTAEACNLRDNYDDLLSRGFVVIGVSPDTEKSHGKFRTKFNLPFSLLADPSAEIIKQYGAWGEKSMYGKKYDGVLRTTFVIGADGLISKIFTKVETGDHTRQILDALGIN